jgi:hypothetical protein
MGGGVDHRVGPRRIEDLRDARVGDVSLPEAEVDDRRLDVAGLERGRRRRADQSRSAGDGDALDTLDQAFSSFGIGAAKVKSSDASCFSYLFLNH